MIALTAVLVLGIIFAILTGPAGASPGEHQQDDSEDEPGDDGTFYDD